MRAWIRATGWLAILGCALAGSAAAAPPNVTLQSGDIIVLDVSDDSVYHYRPGTGAVTTLAHGSVVSSARGVAFSPEGQLFVTDTLNDWLVRIDPLTGDTVPFYLFEAPTFPDPAAAIADEASNWDILVVEADQRRILRIDPVTASGGIEFDLIGTRFPEGLTRDPTDQTLIVADRFSDTPEEMAGIHRVDAAENLQSSVSLSADYLSLRRVAVQSDGTILVTDRGLGGSGEAVYRIDPGTGAHAVFGSFGASFNAPQGIAVDPADDTVLVTDYSNGRLYRLGADGNSRVQLSNAFNGPYDVAVVPALIPRTHPDFLVSEADPGGVSGQVYAAASAAPPAVGTRSPVAAAGGAVFTQPVAMAYSSPDDTRTDGVIYVVDGPARVVSRDLATGVQTVVSEEDLLTEISDIAVEFDGSIVVTDYADGEIIRIDPATGVQELVTDPVALAKPTSIVVDGGGNLLVTCEDVFDDDSDPTNDSRLFRVNPRNGEVEQFLIFASSNGVPLEFLDPHALAIDWNGDVLLIDRRGEDMGGNPLTRIYRILGADGSLALGLALPLSTAVNDQLDTAVSLTVDADRTIVVTFDATQPSRIDSLTGAATTLAIGGSLNLATDVLLEGTPPPGDPTDTDGDDVPDGVDNCPEDFNPDQADVDSDGDGDVCQLFDLDLDGWSDAGDNCQFIPNPDTEGRCAEGLHEDESCDVNTDCDSTEGAKDGYCAFAQIDLDLDGHGDICDNCPEAANALQEDFNGDGVGDACQDSDGDTTLDASDTCKEVPNFVGTANLCSAGMVGIPCETNAGCDSSMGAGDGVCTLTQIGQGTCYEGTKGAPCFEDADCDDVGNDGECSTNNEDFDNDEFGEVCDNCPGNKSADFNPTQSDLNGDGIGDVCQDALGGGFDDDGDGIPENGGPAPCPDGVTVDCADNCPNDSNPDQSDLNGDGDGDACQPNDNDNDGWPNAEDNCPNDANPGQEDGNADGFGDVCQNDGPDPDADFDGIPEGDGTNRCTGGATVGCDDNCPSRFNPDQSDLNNGGLGDGIGDVCQPNDLDNDGWPDAEDNCPNVSNPGQGDQNGDAIPGVGGGDFCQADDPDGDGWPSAEDNCPYYPNADQGDVDGDGKGDFCDNSDGDQYTDAIDNCPLDTNPAQNDTGDGDGAGDLCDNCLDVPNAILQGTCTAGKVGELCLADAECDDGGTSGFCSLDQEDGDHDGIGDACETDADADADGLDNAADNCPFQPNAAALGTCYVGFEGALCNVDDDCHPLPGVGICWLDQEDRDSDGLGDPCDPTPVPEPGGLLMLGSGLALLQRLHRRRARRAGGAPSATA